MNNDLIAKLENLMPTFSKGQRTIAKYIIEHYDKATFMTAAKLGATVGVSESTVVRFAVELGYDGYPELQRVLQEFIRVKLTSVQRMEISDEKMSGGDILGAVLSSDVEKIRQTREEVNRADFEAVVDTIIHARRIYILGVRSAAALANFMGFYFNLVFDNVRLVSTTSVSEMFEQILRAGEGDVVIGISFPRYSRRTVKALQYAKSKGASVIAITDSVFSPLAKYADKTLMARSDMVSFVDSLVAPLSLINALIVSVTMKRRAEVEQSLQNLESIWDEYEVYEKQNDNE